jgi:hypothetical protein
MFNRYLVFLGHCYYADGGWDDFFGFYDSLDECVDAIKNEKFGCDKWAHIVSMDGKIVERFKKEYDYWQGEDGKRV